MLSSPAAILLAEVPESPLHLALRHTGEFWTQTGLTIAHHWVVLLVCAAVPAVERAFAHLRPGQASRTGLAALEAVVTLWRILLIAVAVWAATSGVQWQRIRQHASALAAWQIALVQMAASLAHHLRMVLWEILFLIVVVGLAYWIVVQCVRGLASLGWLRQQRQQRATLSVIRNLVFAPVIVIYLVEMVRPGLQ